jgi:hypothetical protein
MHVPLLGSRTQCRLTTPASSRAHLDSRPRAQEPDTEHSYTIEGGTRNFTFYTAPAPGPSSTFSFVAFGDMGVDTKSVRGMQGSAGSQRRQNAVQPTHLASCSPSRSPPRCPCPQSAPPPSRHRHLQWQHGVALPAPLSTCLFSLPQKRKEKCTGAAATLASLTREFAVSSREGGPSFALHAGDLSYANGHPGVWDEFMDSIEPIASSSPYMVAVGERRRTSQAQARLLGRSYAGPRRLGAARRAARPDGQRARGPAAAPICTQPRA